MDSKFSMRTPLYTVEHLCIQWNTSIPTPWNKDTSVYNGFPLFQVLNEDTSVYGGTPLYTVEHLYSNPLK